MVKFLISRFFMIILLLVFTVCGSFAQTDSLRKRIEKILIDKKAEIGISILGLDDNHGTLNINGSTQFPMLSVYKFHLALAVLHEVDKGNLTFDQQIKISEKELLPNTYSPLKKRYPAGDVTLSVKELLSYTVSHSDNNGCDVLFRLLGGPKKVESFIHGKGVKEVSIVSTEEEINKDRSLFFKNCTTPLASNQLLKLFFGQKILSKSSTDLLWQMMVDTSVGLDRIKGLLPEDAPVAHRTGMAGANAEGINYAFNNVGIVRLPNNKHFAISVFITNSRESNESNAKIIAEVSKAAWDHFLALEN